MKRFLVMIVAAVALSMVGAEAQNVQLFYDTGRGCVTSTVEMFRPDKFGSTYFFIDIDYSPKASGTYWEISRELNFWRESDYDWLSLHVEHNGGHNTAVGSFANAWIAGLTYSGHSADYSKTWSLSAMYRLTPGAKGVGGRCEAHNLQVTGVWGITFANGWCDFAGFAEVWREVKPWLGTSFAFMSEPQLWVNLNKLRGWEDVNLSVGSELELSYNFVDKGFYAFPAIGIKWTF